MVQIWGTVAENCSSQIAHIQARYEQTIDALMLAQDYPHISSIKKYKPLTMIQAIIFLICSYHLYCVKYQCYLKHQD